jgi:predicted RNase H-like nuclease (RuvC/YqgF family)
MKKIYFMLTIASALMMSVLFTGCESTATKKKAEESKIEAAENDIEVLENEVSDDEWAAFKNDVEQIISNNEKRIAEIRANMKGSTKFVNDLREKRIADLEQQNRNLKARLDAFEKSQSNWEQFKSEFQKDMDAISDAFEELGENNN